MPTPQKAVEMISYRNMPWIKPIPTIIFTYNTQSPWYLWPTIQVWWHQSAELHNSCISMLFHTKANNANNCCTRGQQKIKRRLDIKKWTTGRSEELLVKCHILQFPTARKATSSEETILYYFNELIARKNQVWARNECGRRCCRKTLKWVSPSLFSYFFINFQFSSNPTSRAYFKLNLETCSPFHCEEVLPPRWDKLRIVQNLDGDRNGWNPNRHSTHGDWRIAHFCRHLAKKHPHQVAFTPGFAHGCFLKVFFIEFCDYSMLPVKNYELTF